MIDIKIESIDDKPHKLISTTFLVDIINSSYVDIGYIFRTKEGFYLVFYTQIDHDYIVLKHPEWFNVDKITV